MYSAHECKISTASDAFTGRLETTNCQIGAPGQPYVGCKIGVDEDIAKDDGFNKGNIAAKVFKSPVPSDRKILI
jgi:hypothetical protein